MLERIWVVGFSLLLLVGCAEPANKSVIADSNIKKSFSLTKADTPKAPSGAKKSIGPSKTDSHIMAISKSALEKEYLLRVNFLGQTMVPMFENLKSRVVAFRKKNNKLFLMEATPGHLVTNDLPSNLILTSFNIIAEIDDEIFFDFTQGMSQIFVIGDWRASDFSGKSYSYEFASAPIENSYIETAKFTEKNELYIRQIAQVRVAESMNSNIEVRYYLSPYQQNMDFTPTESVSFDRFGFFENAPYLQADGLTKVFASKFDHTKGITFAVSPNTPDEYKQAVRDGVLYWNKAFGEEVVHVVDAPEGITAPHPDFNVVQWVNWDTAGFAYADAQTDPRNGEIKNAQVFMTSVFALSGKRRARRLLQILKESKAKKHQKRIGLKGFVAERMCDLHHDEAFIENVEAMLMKEDITDEMILEASRDYIREVVAHEIGHTLGLRHNFAASMSLNFPLSEREEIVGTYLKTKTVPEQINVASTVMEYSIFSEAAMAGDIVEKRAKALKYDEQAIQVLYKDKDYSIDEMALFCTDSHTMGQFVDCNRFDTGKSVFEDAVWAVNFNIRNLPQDLIHMFAAAKVPVFGGREKDVSEVALNPVGRAARILTPRFLAFRALTDAGSFVGIRRQYSYLDATNIEDVKAKEIEYATSELERMGGVDKVFAPVAEDFAKVQTERFSDLLDKASTNIDGVDVSFSADEKRVILDKVSSFYVILQKALTDMNLKILSGELSADVKGYLKANPKLPKGIMTEHAVSYEIAEYNKNLAKEVLLAKTGESTPATITVKTAKGKKKTITVRLPEYKYKKDTREIAAKMFQSLKGKAADWAYLEKKELTKALEEEAQALLEGEKISSVQLEELSRPALRWVLEFKSLQKQVAK